MSIYNKSITINTLLPLIPFFLNKPKPTMYQIVAVTWVIPVPIVQNDVRYQKGVRIYQSVDQNLGIKPEPSHGLIQIVVVVLDHHY
jgi:hypothetical protein